MPFSVQSNHFPPAGPFTGDSVRKGKNGPAPTGSAREVRTDG